MKTIKDIVGGRNKAYFEYYQNNHLWYNVSKVDFSFPIPIEDCGNGEFKTEEKAITLMRWIRKHYAEVEKAKKDIAAVDKANRNFYREPAQNEN